MVVRNIAIRIYDCNASTLVSGAIGDFDLDIAIFD